MNEGVTLANDWNRSGKGYASLSVTITAMDKATMQTDAILENELEILSYVGELKSDKTKKDTIAYHILNKDTIKDFDKAIIKSVAACSDKKMLEKFHDDWRENGLLFRLNKKWFSVAPRIFNLLGGNSGPRFANLDPGFARNLALANQLAKHPNEIKLIMRFEDGYAKVFSINYGDYLYTPQHVFLDELQKMLETASSQGVGKWQISRWNVDHYRTWISAEIPDFNKEIEKKGMDIYPALVFITSDTGDSSYIARAALRFGDIYFMIDEKKRKHITGVRLDDFFENALSLPTKAIDHIQRLEALKQRPVVDDLFVSIVNKLKLANIEAIGKRDVNNMVKSEQPLLVRDKNAYEVVRRIYGMAFKAKHPEAVAISLKDAVTIAEQLTGGSR